jgi:hypothetical protein
MSGPFWENLSADSILCHIVEKLRETEYLTGASGAVQDEVRLAYEQKGDLSDAQFLSSFIATHPEQFRELKNIISEILDREGQFLPCRNPDFRDAGP